MPPYKSYARVLINPGSDPKFLPGVTACLDAISGMPDGELLLQKITAGKHDVTIVQQIGGGNTCDHDLLGCPPLTSAIRHKNQQVFPKELTTAFDNAKRKGVPIDFFAKQLNLGMTPASYSAKKNVVPPPAPAGKTLLPAAVTMAVNFLEDLASGNALLETLPLGWRYDLPRLLRLYMRPGTGSRSHVRFDPNGSASCKIDPAMNRRPPAIGLAHELIHSLHGSQGTSLQWVVDAGGACLEEVVTTGLPPYNFEELSDNKMRTQWSSKLPLRTQYT